VDGNISIPKPLKPRERTHFIPPIFRADQPIGERGPQMPAFQNSWSITTPTCHWFITTLQPEEYAALTETRHALGCGWRTNRHRFRGGGRHPASRSCSRRAIFPSLRWGDCKYTLVLRSAGEDPLRSSASKSMGECGLACRMVTSTLPYGRRGVAMNSGLQVEIDEPDVQPVSSARP